MGKTNFPHVEKSGKRIRINVKGIFLFGVNESRRVDAPPMQAKVWAAARALSVQAEVTSSTPRLILTLDSLHFTEHND